jgi:ZIP family zinc transporter
MAMDFLPRCEVGGGVYEATGLAGAEQSRAHRRLDRLRLHAVASTALGGALVPALWGLVA